MIRAIGMAANSLGLATVFKAANQRIIRSVRFMQVEPHPGGVRVTPQKMEWAMSKTGTDQLQSQSRSDFL